MVSGHAIPSRDSAATNRMAPQCTMRQVQRLTQAQRKAIPKYTTGPPPTMKITISSCTTTMISASRGSLILRSIAASGGGFGDGALCCGGTHQGDRGVGLSTVFPRSGESLGYLVVRQR